MGRPDAPPDDPVLIVDDRVTAATEEVLAAGVSLGMPRREAEALAPFATVLIRDQGEESRRFEPVVEMIEDLIPRVEVVAPGLVFIPVAGAVRFYGGEEALAERVSKELDRMVGQDRGGQALVGVADGPFAARWAAATTEVGRPQVVTDTIGFLSRLDLTALRESLDADELIDTFRWLGVSTLGELARLPRHALATRFGDHGLLAHRLASGEDRFVDSREIPPDLAVDASFDEPLESLDAVAFAARALAERLLRGLRASGVAPHRVSILAEAAAGEPRERIWRSADPFTEKALSDRVWWQLRAWVESGGVPGGISRLRIAPADLSDEGRQLGLLQDETSRIEAERALARAQAMLGPDGVLQGRAQGGRMPQERVAWSRWGEPSADRERDVSAPWPGATPSPSPALVPPLPQPLEVEWDGGMPTRVRLGTRWEPVLTWSGPWRLTGRWWAGEGDADRYQLVTSVGAFLCVVTEGRAFLAGVYD
ncbi:MAG: DNA polymerase Y family protein [Acidimicrobiia bacterium]